MSEPILNSRTGRIQRLTLNSPDTRNQLTFAMCRTLVGALQDADGDPDVGVIHLAANGPIFCAGMDPRELSRPEAAELGWIHEELFTVGSKITTPILCEVQGMVAGAGVGLLCNSHLVIAAQGSSFGLTEIRGANWPFMIFRSLTLAMGERRALELALTGRMFGTNEALQYGLIHAVSIPVELEDRVEGTLQLLANASPDAIRRGLDFVHQTRGKSWTEAGLLAQQIRTGWFAHPDFLEGQAAIAENRKPHWPSMQPKD
ncbi:MAG: enoyl-CoA hydratase/isomerase family protein [Bryobacterales bacterium]|jgi:enoyl-CoA hydratase/carnithine racemase|nr:enoyl-CoA hydratase/isomerase family protein [Bryobacterales bacterium]